MRRAEAILGLISERGKEGKPLERVYRLLFNPDLYLAAYGKIGKNKGALTPGVTAETVDGMSVAKVEAIIDLIRNERYRWKPARRVYIPKANGKKRPLGLPTWSDKVVQEVVRMILEAYYEPRFSPLSFGFRPGRGCHDALREIYGKWTGVSWFIEGDISGCFDAIDHTVLLDILKEAFRDGRFIQLISTLLEAGYLEEWAYHKTYSGTPQGGIVSPILANIYLDRLDRFITETLIPKWTRGQTRRTNPKYESLHHEEQTLRRRGKRAEAKAVWKHLRNIPSKDTNDPGFRRLKYVRYADDFLLGFAGPKEEAEQIKEEIRQFLGETLKLELSQAKTLVTHGRTEEASFLGYGIKVLQADAQRQRLHSRRTINGKIGLRVPKKVVQQKVSKYSSKGKPKHRAEKLADSDGTIIEAYQSEFRGLVNYYRMAYNLAIALGMVKTRMERSLAATLANKYKISITRVYDKYKGEMERDGRKYKILKTEVGRPGREPRVFCWGGIPLKWSIKAALQDEKPNQWVWVSRTEMTRRLIANECEYCGSTEAIEMHHVRALKDLNHKGKDVPDWKRLMSARRRKQMALCRTCHQDVTYGRPMRNKPSGTGFMFNRKIKA